MAEQLKQGKVHDLIQDDRNLNKGTERGQQLIEKSLRQFGAGRSILVDKNNRIIAGNKTHANAEAAGIDDAVIVETDGSKLVVVKRTDIDLDTKQGREMALADNATVKVDLAWDTEQLDAVVEDYGIDAEEWDVAGFGDDEQTSQQKDPANSVLDVDGFGDKIKMVFELSIEEHAFIQQRLSQDGMTKEQVLLNLLGYAEQ